MAGRILLVVGVLEYVIGIVFRDFLSTPAFNVGCIAIAIFTLYVERRTVGNPEEGATNGVRGVTSPSSQLQVRRTGFDVTGGSLRLHGTKISGVDTAIKAKNAKVIARDTEVL
jgi:hypothetical protein